MSRELIAQAEALSCPHCGAAPLVHDIEPHTHVAAILPDHKGSTVVECGCGAGMIDEDRAKVLARWNRRVQAEQPAEKVIVRYPTEQGVRVIDAEQPASDWLHLKPFGYAPGDYMNKCLRCGERVDAVDKRATSCRPCAEKAFAAAEQPADTNPLRLWLWRNFVNGRPEYWAFDNPYPIHMDCGDPMTIGEPCGYAFVFDSRNGRPDVSDEAVLRAVERVNAAPPEKKAEQPAEPVIVGTGNTRILVQPAEPVAEVVRSSYGFPTPMLAFYGSFRELKRGDKLYLIPDPRIAALTGLTNEVALIRSVLNGYPQSMARADALRAVERIEAALNASQTERN